MRIQTVSTLLLAAITHVICSSPSWADGRSRGSSSPFKGGGGGMHYHSPPSGGGRAPMSVKLPAGSVPTFSSVQNNSITRNITRVPVRNDFQVAPRRPNFNTPIKMIDLGVGHGKPPVVIDPGFGQGKSPIVIDPGFGQGKPPILIDSGKGNGGKPPIVIDPGIGNAKPPIHVPGGLGIGKGNIKFHPGLIGQSKTPQLPFNPGIKIPVKPKIPLCPPHPYPHHPPHCPPCPPIFHGWCWFPGFGSCYGYAGGLSLPIVNVNPLPVELPMGDMYVNGSLPQIVPGTTVTSIVVGAGDPDGRVMLQYNAIAIPVQVMNWEDAKVTFVVPDMALQEPVAVKLIFLRADGRTAQEVDAELVAVTVQPPQS